MIMIFVAIYGDQKMKKEKQFCDNILWLRVQLAMSETRQTELAHFIIKRRKTKSYVQV